MTETLAWLLGALSTKMPCDNGASKQLRTLCGKLRGEFADVKLNDLVAEYFILTLAFQKLLSPLIYGNGGVQTWL